VDSVIGDLLPHLEKDDLIIDAGNSYYKDTNLRARNLTAQCIQFLGVGVSGGEGRRLVMVRALCLGDLRTHTSGSARCWRPWLPMLVSLRHLRTGEQRSAKVDELIVVKPFGEAIYPCLTPIGKVAKGGDRPWHAAINGENYHALQLLLYLYEGKADCIYLDPPYNTGARDWTYNNRFVDANDSYRHSKWLSFMEKRVRLAKRLLKADGVLIITIDEHEVHHLGMLLELLSRVSEADCHDRDQCCREQQRQFLTGGGVCILLLPANRS
jgi:hypothetical protein